ncbi:LuxR C-terminal-related transcriptional regulator [Streptomyces sp. NPDC048639]|uniref:helix-turn-helix transcriptional regulator n=1 Tax=Streptomyces sp. NPDC048639 TaxID=3365581 RepID=UPI00371CED9A
MSAADDERWLTRALAELESPDTVLFLVEGVAGAGKSRLVDRVPACGGVCGAERLTVVLTAAGGRVVRWRSPESEPVRTPLSALVRSSGPVLLVVEDVHQADPRWLHQLRRLLEDPPPGLVCLLTYRPEELPAPGLVLGRTAHLPARLDVQRLRLAPLSPAEVGQMAAARLGEGRCPPEVVSALHLRSAGNPQVVVDLLRALTGVAGRGDGELRVEDVHAVGVPARLAQLVLGRDEALADEHRPVVRAAAVLGATALTTMPLSGPASAIAPGVSSGTAAATVPELAAIAGLDDEDGRLAVVAALEDAVLQEGDQARYGFPIPLASIAVYEGMPGPVRQELHRRAADVLALRRPVPWGDVAAHRLSGGQMRHWARAVAQAAFGHTRRGEHESAARLLEEALASPAAHTEVRVHLGPLLARSAAWASGTDRTAVLLAEIADDEGLPEDVRVEVRLHLGLLLHSQRGLGERGRSELRAVADRVRTQPAAAARAMSELAKTHWPGTALSENLRRLRQAEAAADDSGDPCARAAVAADRVAVLMSIGDPGAYRLADQLADGAHVPDAHVPGAHAPGAHVPDVHVPGAHAPDAHVPGAHAPASQGHTARGLYDAAHAALWLGHSTRAGRLLRAGADRAVRYGARNLERAGQGTALLLDWTSGRWTNLTERCQATLRDGHPLSGPAARVVLGLLALARGERGEAAAWLSADGLPGPDRGPVPLLSAAAAARVRLALAGADSASAVAESVVAWAALREKGVWAWASDLAPWAVRAMAGAGQRGPAAEMTAELAAFADEAGAWAAPAAAAASLWCRGILAETGDEPGGAAAAYQEASASYGRLPRPYEAALTLEAAGRCAMAAAPGDTDAALRELTASADRFQDLGAVRDATRVRALLRAHRGEGPNRSPGRPSYGTRLSPREEEVSSLAAAGMRNKEIAATLHLSARTVEQHVSQAMRKLGVASRRDLAGPRTSE